MGAEIDDPALRLVLEAGPSGLAFAEKTFRLELAKSCAQGPYLEACKQIAQQEVADMHAEIEALSIAIAATDWKASKTHIPYCRIPASVIQKMKDIYGDDCWRDEDFLEDFLKHHPGLRVNVKRGMRGQEYVRGH